MELRIKLTTVIQEDPEGGYIGFIEEIPGINTQGETKEEVQENLFDALTLSMEYHREEAEKAIGKNQKGIFKQAFELVSA